GKLEAELARLLDELQVLVGERQDRDFRQIDLLLAGEREQEIERAFEALDIDHQCRLAAGAVGLQLRGGIGFQLDLVRAQYVALPVASAASITAANSLRAAATSRPSTFARRASAAPARAAASPASTGAAAATARISSRLPLQWRITSQPAAIAERERSAIA